MARPAVPARVLAEAWTLCVCPTALHGSGSTKYVYARSYVTVDVHDSARRCTHLQSTGDALTPGNGGEVCGALQVKRDLFGI